MEVIVTEQDGIAIVELAGRMDATTTPEFENATRALLEAGKQRLLIDMSRLEYISSAGLRGILGLVKALKACTGKLAFCSLQPMTAEVFRISGFNAMLTRQKEQEGEANVTTILFDHEVQLLHDRFPLKAVAPLTEKDYYVRGCTALLDAIGYGVEKMANIQRHLPESERAEKVIFVITTDGLENASKRFGYEKIRRMIEREKERYGWEFLFLGANMDAVQEAARFGISSDRAVRFENDAQGVAVNYHVVSETVCRMRQAACPASIGAEWKEEIEADFKKRHQG